MSISIVRLAFVTSVTCGPPFTPPVKFQISQVSIVPNSTSPRSARSRSPGVCVEHPADPRRRRSRSSAADRTGRRTGPARRRRPAPRQASVRVSCQTTAWPIGCRCAVPEQGGLPLVGDADRDDLGRVGAELADRGRDHPGARSARSRSRRARPSPAAGTAAGARAAPPRPAARAGRTGCTGSSWSPGRPPPRIAQP